MYTVGALRVPELPVLHVPQTVNDGAVGDHHHIVQHAGIAAAGQCDPLGPALAAIAADAAEERLVLDRMEALALIIGDQAAARGGNDAGPAIVIKGAVGSVFQKISFQGLHHL